ncbi:MAG: helix-turn-helix domain-containing protein [Acutalibacteraceae bacterium]
MTLGEKLSKLRKENNYTQEQLAEVLGVSRQAISKWESDVTYPETDKLVRICKLFHCSTDYLLLDDAELNTTSGNQAETGAEYAEYTFKKIFRERKSEKTVFGMPLWHIGRNAKGFVAVGMNAKGVIAVGLKAQGIVSLGLLSIGLISFGMLSLGLLSCGMLAIGGLCAGCFAIGIMAAGAISLGTISLGAIAIGEFSVGALAVGKYIAIGDNARAMIALGDSFALGGVYQKIGELAAQDIAAVKQLLDSNVPTWLSWAKEIVKLFI